MQGADCRIDVHEDHTLLPTLSQAQHRASMDTALAAHAAVLLVYSMSGLSFSCAPFSPHISSQNMRDFARALQAFWHTLAPTSAPRKHLTAFLMPLNQGCKVAPSRGADRTPKPARQNLSALSSRPYYLKGLTGSSLSSLV